MVSGPPKSEGYDSVTHSPSVKTSGCESCGSAPRSMRRPSTPARYCSGMRSHSCHAVRSNSSNVTSRNRQDRVLIFIRDGSCSGRGAASEPAVDGEEEGDGERKLQRHVGPAERAPHVLGAHLPEPPADEHQRLQDHEPYRPVPPAADANVRVAGVDER